MLAYLKEVRLVNYTIVTDAQRKKVDFLIPQKEANPCAELNPYCPKKDAILKGLKLEHKGLRVEEVTEFGRVYAKVYERGAPIKPKYQVISSVKSWASYDSALIQLPDSSFSGPAKLPCPNEQLELETLLHFQSTFLIALYL